jgi:hypothetical protein
MDDEEKMPCGWDESFVLGTSGIDISVCEGG